MTRILFLSDLHFGLARRELCVPLLRRANAAGAGIAVVTGDLTHRARRSQFDAAAKFLNHLDAPWIAVPGNHDVPPWDPWERLRSPFRRYREAIADDLAPRADLDGVRIQCANSTDPTAWERGRIRARLVQGLISGLAPDCVNIIAMHHPLEHGPGVDKPLARGAAAALTRLEQAGAQILLSGHLHRWTVDALQPPGGRPLLQIQAASALCARLGDRQNEFVVLDVGGTDLVIERHVSPMPDPDFLPPEISRYSRAGGLWRRVG